MTGKQNMSAKFRAALKNELPVWLQEGFVSEQTAKQLSEKYQLDHLQAESSRLLSAVIFTIGALLLGGGLITFVAANWEEISTPVKLAILFSALLAFHIVGFWLWHHKGWSRLGHALIFCGCLVFGANIGLVAQIFHIRGNWYGAFGAWAIGSLAMAWAVRSWITGLLAVFTSFIWFTGFHSDGNQQTSIAYPLVLAAGVIPLAIIVRSRVLYAATFLAVITATGVIAGFDGEGKQMVLAMAAGGFLAWTAGKLHRLTNWYSEFANVTVGLGLSALALAAYIGSFHGVWDSSIRKAALSPLAILFLAIALALSVLWFQREAKERLWLSLAVLIVAVQLCGCAMLASATANDAEVLFTLLTNIAALVLAAVMIGIGLIDEQRAVFWLGSLYIVLLILSRFLEYDTSLLLKSAAFLACGVAVILAGISYEKYLRRKASQSESDEGSKSENGGDSKKEVADE